MTVAVSGVLPLDPFFVQLGALQASTPAAGPAITAPDLNLRPRQPIEIRRLYLPLFVQLIWVVSGTVTPVNAHLELSLRLRGALLWLQALSLSGTPVYAGPVGGGGAGEYVSHSQATAADDLVNPIHLELADTLELGYELAVDQPVDQALLALGYAPAPILGVVPTPGSLYYSSS